MFLYHVFDWRNNFVTALISSLLFAATHGLTPTKLTPVMVYPVHEALKQRRPVQISDGETVNWQEAAGDLSCADSNTNTSFHLEGRYFISTDKPHFHFLLLANCCSKARMSWQLMPILLVEGKKDAPSSQLPPIPTSTLIFLF